MLLQDILIYIGGSSAATDFAAEYLSSHGISVCRTPSPQVTHLLLDVPSFDSSGQLRGGGMVSSLLEMLPRDVCVIGGNLSHPVLEGYRLVDLLQREDYLCRNAAITAHCALGILISHLPCTISQAPALILGWGRIGKCLAHMLQQNGGEVWLAIRNPRDRALAEALGFHTLDIARDMTAPDHIRVLFNTIPGQVLCKEHIPVYSHCLKIDLASAPGMGDDSAIIARGLPGKYAPESSGRLIGRTIENLILGGTI